MKNLHLFIFVILAILFCENVSSIEKFSNIRDAVNSYPSQDRQIGGRPKFIYIKMRENLPRSIEYYSNLFFKFLSTVGVRPYFVNMNDSHLVGIFRYESVVDVEVFKETFEDFIVDAEIKEKLNDI